MAKGQNVQQVLRDVCGTFEEVAHSNGAVASFAINDGDGEEEDEDDMGNEEEWVQALKQQEIGSFPHEIAPVPDNPSLAQPSSAAAAAQAAAVPANPTHPVVTEKTMLAAAAVDGAVDSGSVPSMVDIGSKAGGPAAEVRTTAGDTYGRATTVSSEAAAATRQQGPSGSRSGSDTALAQLSMSDTAAAAVGAGSTPASESPKAASAVGETVHQSVTA